MSFLHGTANGHGGGPTPEEAEQYRQARLYMRLTQDQLAHALKLDRRTIARRETGQCRVTQEMLMALELIRWQFEAYKAGQAAAERGPGVNSKKARQTAGAFGKGRR